MINTRLNNNVEHYKQPGYSFRKEEVLQYFRELRPAKRLEPILDKLVKLGLIFLIHFTHNAPVYIAMKIQNGSNFYPYISYHDNYYLEYVNISDNVLSPTNRYDMSKLQW